MNEIDIIREKSLRLRTLRGLPYIREAESIGVQHKPFLVAEFRKLVDASNATPIGFAALHYMTGIPFKTLLKIYIDYGLLPVSTIDKVSHFKVGDLVNEAKGRGLIAGELF